MYLAKNIRYLRRKAEMSQDTLAELLGYKSYTTIQKWESGINEPPIGTVQKIANLFHVELDDMVKVDMENTDAKRTYYLDEKTADIAQAILENKELSLLFDAARDARPGTLETAHALLLALKKKEEES